ncbi:hypothetical protein [Nocardia salmonicida]|uniref:hypothetical protein n=1 Tax=Nocardia salmonicida TaxID=53431 RepID=UPI003CE76CAB
MGSLDDAINADRNAERQAQRGAEERRVAEAAERKDKQQLVDEFIALVQRHNVPTQPYFLKTFVHTPKSFMRKESKIWHIDYAGECWTFEGEWGLYKESVRRLITVSGEVFSSPRDHYLRNGYQKLDKRAESLSRQNKPLWCVSAGETPDIRSVNAEYLAGVVRKLIGD